MNDQLNAESTSEKTRTQAIHTHSLTHSNEKGGHEKNDYDGKMIFGDLVGLKLPDICLIGEEIPHPGNLSRPGFEPGPAA